MLEVTEKWVTAKVPDVAPAGINKVLGTEATLGESLVSDTEMPPVGAAPDNVTVPVTTVFELPWTEEG